MDTITKQAEADVFQISNFIDQGLKLYEKQRLVVRDLESEQALFRAQVADGFKRRMADLFAEEADRLRTIDARQKTELEAARQLLAVLARLRGE